MSRKILVILVGSLLFVLVSSGLVFAVEETDPVENETNISPAQPGETSQGHDELANAMELGTKIFEKEVLIFNAVVSGGSFKRLIAKGMSAQVQFKIEPITKKKFSGKYKISMTPQSEETEKKVTIVEPHNLSFLATSYATVAKQKQTQYFKANIRTVKDDFSDINVREILEKDLKQKENSRTTELMENYPVYDLNGFLFLARCVKKFDDLKTVYFFEKGMLRPVEIQFGKKLKIDYQGKQYTAEEFIVSYRQKNLFKFYISRDQDRLPLRIEFGQSCRLELSARHM